MRTILIVTDDERSFEEAVNKSLEELVSEGKEVIDIKYSTHGASWGDGEYQNSMHSALIIHKN